MEQKNSIPIKPRPGATNKTTILIVSALANVIVAFMISGVNVALPVINKEFNANVIVLNWVFTSYILAVAVFCVPFGRLADIIGIKKIFTYGTVIFTLAAIASIFSNSIEMLIAFRAIQGLGSAMTASTSIAMLTAAYPAKERGRAIGLNVAAVYVGLSLGPILGGLLVEHFDWRSIFITNIPFGLIILGLLFWKIKGEWQESKGEKFDYSGSVIYGLALVALMYGFSRLPNVDGVIITILGALGILGFGFWENRTKSPILDLSIFRGNKTFVFSNLASLVNYSSTGAISFLLSLYLQYIKGFSADKAGLVLIAQPIVMTLVSPFAGRLSDKIEPRIVASIGMSLTCIGLLSFAFLTNDSSVIQIVIALIVVGAGFGLFTSPNTNAIMSSVKPKHFAVAASITSTMRTIGQTLSTGITMIIFAVVIGPVVISQAYYPAFLSSAKIGFAIFAALCFAGIFASLARGQKENAEAERRPEVQK